MRAEIEGPATTARRRALDNELAEADSAIAALPAQRTVYAGAVHTGSGAFVGTGARGGMPREIRVLARGQVTQPGRPVEPAALSVLDGVLPSRFDLAPDAPESARRAALARRVGITVSPGLGLGLLLRRRLASLTLVAARACHRLRAPWGGRQPVAARSRGAPAGPNRRGLRP